MNGLFIFIGLLGAAYMLKKDKSISGIGRTWYGGNSGYQGYSMSKRAVKHVKRESTQRQTSRKCTV